MSQMVQHGPVVICYDPVEEYARTSMGVKWCFKCRKRREFFWVCWRPTDRMSYYGPHGAVQDNVCETADSDLFPGWSREEVD